MAALYFQFFSLIFCSVLGYVAGRFYHVDQKSVAALILYILSPVFNFYVMASTPLPVSSIWLVPLYSGICLTIGATASVLAHRLFADSRANLLAMTLSVPNLGFFGVPVVLLTLGEEYLATQVLLGFGTALCAYTYGFYILNRSKFSTKACLTKVFTLPILYATIGGFLFQKSGLQLPVLFVPTLALFKGAYSVLGVMMIGIALGRVSAFTVDFRLLSYALLGKYLAYPLLTGFVLFLDAVLLQSFVPATRLLLLLSAFMPLGLNTVNFAALIGVREAEAASLVVISTGLSVLVLPIIIFYAH